ncbi:MAG: PucR family transcriptional regulator [Clostridiales bacterium]|nr:PucR family transcriptional regulator [Clostridiales bacterium]
MKITVNDCLNLKAFKDSSVLSCKKKLNRRVKTISVLDEPDADKGVERNGIKDQMVITHFWLVKDDVDKQISIVRGLAHKEISALVIYLNENGVRSVDPKIIDAAEAEGLIIITINNAANITYAMLIEQVSDKILYGYNFSDNIVNNTIYHLLNFEKHKSFPNALKEAAIYNGYQIVLMTEEFNPILTVETRQMVTVEDAVQVVRKENSFHTNKFTKVPINGIVSYWGYLDIGDQKYILVIVDNDDRYSAVEMEKLADAIGIAIGMWKYTPKRDSKAEFIKSAIRGDLSFCHTLLDEAALKGMKFTSVFMTRYLDSDEVLASLAEYSKEYEFEMLTSVEGEKVFGMIFDSGDREKAVHIKNACLDMYDKLKSGRKNARLFHVTGIETVEAAVDGFRLINKTRKYIEAVFPYKRVFSKYEMSMVCDCVYLNSDAPALKKLYLDLLEPFEREISPSKGKLLLDTLGTFILDAGMNSNKTAKFMEIHNNTVQYRLKKANEILGAEMTANRIIPGLTMALAIKRLEEM